MTNVNAQPGYRRTHNFISNDVEGEAVEEARGSCRNASCFVSGESETPEEAIETWRVYAGNWDSETGSGGGSDSLQRGFELSGTGGFVMLRLSIASFVAVSRRRSLLANVTRRYSLMPRRLSLGTRHRE